LEDIDGFFWKMRMYRLLAISALDALVGWAMYLSSTNRAFVTPIEPSERIEASTKLVESVRSKLSATGVIRNTVIRAEPLRARSQAYWVHEVRLTGEMMEQREVVEGVNNALESRINIDRITADAETYAQNLMGSVQAVDT
jgi:hypothetical protein